MARKPASNQFYEGANGAKSARTRQRIMDATASVLSQKGYSGTRLSDVAEQAQLQAPAIYYYFPSREELIEEVMHSGIANMVLHLRSILDELPAETAPMERIEAAVAAHLQHELEVSDYTTASIRNAGQVPEVLRTRYDIEANKYGDIWRRLLRDAKKAGELRTDIDLRAARMLILGALNWAAEWWHPRRGALNAVIRTAQSMIRDGLSAGEQTETSPTTVADKATTKKSGGTRTKKTSPL